MTTRLRYPHDNPMEVLMEYRRGKPDKVFLVDEKGRTLTYGKLYEYAIKLASALSNLDIGKGDIQYFQET